MKKLILIVFIHLIVIASFVSAQELQSCDSIADVLADTLYETKNSTSEKSTRVVINSFCLASAFEDKDKNKIFSCKNDDLSVYDIRESLFVRSLCHNLGTGDYSKEFNQNFKTGDGFLKTIDFSDLGIVQYGWSEDDLCDPNAHAGLDECSLEKHFPNLFTQIMNDYFDIKQTNAYGITDFEAETEDVVNTFSKRYFGFGTRSGMCAPKTKYLNSCNLMKDYVNNIKGLLRTTIIINTANLKGDESKCHNMESNDYDYMYCGLLGNKILPYQHFVNTIYNELFWYKMFMHFYQESILQDPGNFLGYSDLGLDPLEKLKLQQDKVYKISQATNRLESAVSISLSSLWETHNTFPYHIGLTMYQEDLYNLRKRMSKIYSPIVTLYDKLRNVQDADS